MLFVLLWCSGIEWCPLTDEKVWLYMYYHVIEYICQMSCHAYYVGNQEQLHFRSNSNNTVSLIIDCLWVCHLLVFVFFRHFQSELVHRTGLVIGLWQLVVADCCWSGRRGQFWKSESVCQVVIKCLWNWWCTVNFHIDIPNVSHFIFISKGGLWICVGVIWNEKVAFKAALTRKKQNTFYFSLSLQTINWVFCPRGGSIVPLYSDNIIGRYFEPYYHVGFIICRQEYKWDEAKNYALFWKKCLSRNISFFNNKEEDRRSLRNRYIVGKRGEVWFWKSGMGSLFMWC